MIHQTSIPGLPGNEGFKTREDVAKVAELVMSKIRKRKNSVIKQSINSLLKFRA